MDRRRRRGNVQLEKIVERDMVKAINSLELTASEVGRIRDMWSQFSYDLFRHNNPLLLVISFKYFHDYDKLSNFFNNIEIQRKYVSIIKKNIKNTTGKSASDEKIRFDLYRYLVFVDRILQDPESVTRVEITSEVFVDTEEEEEEEIDEEIDEEEVIEDDTTIEEIDEEEAEQFLDIDEDYERRFE